MIYLDAEQTRGALPWAELINALQDGFVAGCHAPIRQQHTIPISGEAAGNLLLMPAWIEDAYIGVKQVVVVPENAKRGLPAVQASYQLSSAQSGQLLAMIDGEVLTHRRTAAASALASLFLSNPNSEHLLMVGTGGMARSLIPAHCAIRPIKKISIWGRNLAKSKALADEISSLGYHALAIEDLAGTAADADIISCATLAQEPIIKSTWVKAGTHIDLVGAYTPTMREADADLVNRALVYVDTRAGAAQEAGDLILAAGEAKFDFDNIRASLRELASHAIEPHYDPSEVTMFKSVGTALEDLYAAILAYNNGEANDSKH